MTTPPVDLRSLPATPSCLLFDLDGTFADTAPDMARALNKLRAESQLPPLSLNEIRPYVSQGARGMIGVGLGIKPDHDNFKEIVAHFLNLYEEDICVETRLFDGIPMLIDYALQQHIPWGIVTNKASRFTEPLMRGLGWRDRANIVVSGDTCSRAKPHPDSLLHATTLLNCDPQLSIYVGDDLRDIQAAHAAGMIAIGVRYGYLGTENHIDNWGADLLIDHPTELISLLQSAKNPSSLAKTGSVAI